MTRPEVGTYDLEDEKMAAVTFTAVPESGGIELYVAMHDGSIYSFTAYTPQQLSEMMARNGWLSFVDLDTLIIGEPSLEAVMHALAQVMLLDVAHFGIQVNEPETVAGIGMDDPWAGL